jgi:2-phospho-L-lactate/phosphoenolpyruvate guanylyltransferase
MSSSRPETIAVLPVKRWDSAKQRLAEDFGKGTRRALVEAMVTDVLIALRRSAKVDLTLVITREPGVEALAHGYDADTVHDTAEETHSAAAALGVQRAVERGARRVLLIPGDCPALDPKDLDALLSRRVAEDGEVVLVPDRHGTGTNALLLTPPQVIVPAFGPGSRERHERLAAEAGVACRVEEIRSLVLDVDTADDLEVVREALGEGVGNAAHTRGMLSRLARR